MLFKLNPKKHTQLYVKRLNRQDFFQKYVLIN